MKPSYCFYYDFAQHKNPPNSNTDIPFGNKKSGEWARGCDFKKRLRDLIQPVIILTESKHMFKNAAALKGSNSIDMLRYKTLQFSKKHWMLKTVKTSYISANSFLYLWKYLVKQNENYIFMIRKDWRFRDQNLQLKSVVILDKKLKIFILIFFSFNSFFFQNIFHCNIPLGRVFQRYQIYLILITVQKVIYMKNTLSKSLRSQLECLLSVTLKKIN